MLDNPNKIFLLQRRRKVFKAPDQKQNKTKSKQ